jgi:hypothetical protein
MDQRGSRGRMFCWHATYGDKVEFSIHIVTNTTSNVNVHMHDTTREYVIASGG